MPSATRSTRPGSMSAAPSRGSAPTASRRSCATSTGRSLPSSWPPPVPTGPTPATSAATDRPATSTPSTSTTPGATDDRQRWAPRERTVRPEHDPRDPARRPRGHLRHPRVRSEATAPALRRPAVPRGQRVPLPARGLPRAMRHERDAGHPLRQEAAGAEDPRHHRRHELRRAVGPGQGGARPRGQRSRDVLEIKIGELREITDWEKPIFVKVGATRTYYDVQLAVKAGADVIVLDGMQGGTAATQEVFIEHVGIPTLPAVVLAVKALEELGMHRKVQLIVSGGIRTGADVAKALALGADAVSIGVAALIALGDNSPDLAEEYAKIGSAPGFYDDWQAGLDPAGISTQDAELAERFDPIVGGRRLANYLSVLTLETQTLARAC